MTEQSSTSKTENPKHKNALTEKYKEETEKLPKPTGWRILVLPFRMDENCLLYTSPSPRDRTRYRMPSSA